MAAKRRNTRSSRPAPAGPDSHEFVEAFVWQVIRTGFMLQELLGNLLEDLPEDAFPGENTTHVLVEMLTGTIRPVAERAGEPQVRRATRLLNASGEKVVEDLRAALALRMAMDRGAHQG
jgi:hypothetical protein